MSINELSNLICSSHLKNVGFFLDMKKKWASRLEIHVWITHLAAGVWKVFFLSMGNGSSPTHLLIPKLSLRNQQHTIVLSSQNFVAWVLSNFGCLGELPMRGNSANDLWHPFQQMLIEDMSFFPPNHPSVFSYVTFQFQKHRRQAFFSHMLGLRGQSRNWAIEIYCIFVYTSNYPPTQTNILNRKWTVWNLLFVLAIKMSDFYEGNWQMAGFKANICFC